MSLLMDALKKAEKAKQEAEQQESVNADVHEPQAAGAPVSSIIGKTQATAQSEQSQPPITENVTRQHAPTIDFKTEETPGTPPTVAETKPHIVAPAGSADMSLQSRPDLDQSTMEQPAAVAPQSPELSLQDPLSYSSGKAGNAESKEAAKNVFVAKAPEKTLPRYIKYTIAAGSVVFILFLVTGYAYYQSISESLQSDINAAVSPVIRQQQQLAQKELNAPQIKGRQKAEIAAPVVNSPVLQAKKQISTTKAATKSVASVSVVKAKPIQNKPAASVPRSAPIMIKRQLAQDTVYQLLSQAYAAYQLGNDGEAVFIYSKVLQQENNNRDAMLGLAAISVRNAQYEKARDTYLALLENNPKDSVAMSGLLNIQSNVDPGKSESEVKLLLDHNPGSPYLLFTLGSLYASQQRWAEAQSAFFKAYSSDSRNADITYNLAVSLDQLAQKKVALKYYRVALELVKNQPVTFKVNDVMRRINVLQEVSGG